MGNYYNRNIVVNTNFNSVNWWWTPGGCLLLCHASEK